MPNVKMGFEGQIFYGAAGATGATQITNATDMSYDFDPQKGDTTVRGTGTTVPVDTESVTSVKASIEFTMINDITDSVLQALLTAAASGAGVALRLKDFAAGKGFDGDVTLGVKQGMPIKGQQTKAFTASACRDYGRAPQLYV